MATKDPADEAQEQHEAAQKEALVAALKRERVSYEARDRKDELAAVDAELKRLGVTRDKAHTGRETATSDRTEKR
jgi:hypothetical protein